MKPRINPKQADSIIKSLEAGVVPRRGIQHLLVGRKAEIAEIINILERISSGQSDIRFWVGDFGSGKSFMLKTIESLAIQKNFVVSTVDLTPTRRFYASDKKAKALYSEIVSNLATQSSQDGAAIGVIIERWLQQLAQNLADQWSLTTEKIFSGDYCNRVKTLIIDQLSAKLGAGLGYEMAQAIAIYYQAMVDCNSAKKQMALRWLRADIDTKTEAKRQLGIMRIIGDDNWYDALKNLSALFSAIGYAGFVVNFDEAVNLYKIAMSQTRERNYEKILNIYNECKTDAVKGLFVNFGATRKTVYDDRRGMASYGALKGRLGGENERTEQLVNTNKTALVLKPLTVEEIYLLLENLNAIYNVHYKQAIDFSADDIHFYMEEQLNRPGAAEFLTPRSVIKDFLELLDLARQNPQQAVHALIAMYFGRAARPVCKDSANTDDDIEIL